MKKAALQIDKILQYSKAVLILSVFLINSYTVNCAPRQMEIDSVKLQLSKCSSDTCQFRILSNMFWKSRFANSFEGDYYGEWAFQLIKNSKDLKTLSNGYDIKTNLLMKDRKFDSAKYYLSKALTISKQIGYKFRENWCYYGLGEVNNNLGNSQASIDDFKLAKIGFDTTLDPWHTSMINYFIAENFKRLGIFDSAIFYYRQKDVINKKYNDKKSELYNTLDIAECYNLLKDIRKSAECLYGAFNMADSMKNEDALISVYWKAGDFFSQQVNNYSLARTYYFKVLDYAFKHDEKKLKSQAYCLIGKTYLEEGSDSLALIYILKSYTISKEINYRHLLSDVYFNLGYTYKKLGKTQLALDNFKLCWKTKCDYCLPLSFHEALIEIGDIYLGMKNLEQTKYWYKESYQLADSFKAKAQIAKSLFRFGDYYRELKDFNNAQKKYFEALKISKEIRINELIKSIADTLCVFYKSKNDFKTAFSYLTLARQVEDSIFNAEKQTSISKLQMNFEFEKIRKDKELRELEINKQKSIRNHLLAVSVLLIIIALIIFLSYRRKKKDNSLLKAKNAEIESQIEEITAQKDTIERISEQLHEADQSKLNFFTNISHELRTPLTLIISPLTRLLQSTEDKNTGLYSLMLRNARKLHNLINQLLDISRLDKGELKLNVKQYNLNRQLRIAAAMFQSVAEEKNISFKVVEKEKNIIACFDAERLDQIINNLLSNAFKFTSDGGKITLTLDVIQSLLSDYIEIRISDNGIGIPDESINKVFDRFYQSNATVSRNFEGSGIGLALVKELVELHNGKITVSSIPGKTTVFTVLLPLLKEGENVENFYPEHSNITSEKGDSLLKKENSGKQKESILIVEDNADLRQYLHDCLIADFEVLLASNGNEGFETATRKIPNIIVSDVMMPEKNGYELTSMIKTHIETSHIPVILLTAKAGRESKIEGLECGADDYINKPFDEEELLLKVRNIINGRRRMQEKFRKLITVNPSETNAESLEEKFLVKLTEIIESELSNANLDAEFICNKINLSHSQLNRKLNALTNLSINQFVRSLRLKKAAQLIQKKSATVSEIAYMTGFENLSYFTKKFKEEFGTLPSEYI